MSFVLHQGISFPPRLWDTHRVTSIKDRLPKQHDTVTVEGRTGRFVIVGIDSIHKTVEVKTTSALPVVIVKGVPWADLSYPE